MELHVAAKSLCVKMTANMLKLYAAHLYFATLLLTGSASLARKC